MSKKTEYAWVIERGDSEVAKPLYFAGLDESGGEEMWKFDHLKAVRFSRREDGQAVADGLLQATAIAHRIAEHGWG